MRSGGAIGALPCWGRDEVVYARSTTVIAKPEMIDTAIAQVRDEVLPAIQGMKGCLGLSMLIDRETGRGIVTTAWETIEDLTTSREMVREMRDRVTQTLGADKADVEEWEVAAMHRNHHTSEGACARVTWLKGDPADLDRAVDVYKLAAVPAMEELPGFCSSQPARRPGHRARRLDGDVRQPRGPRGQPRPGRADQGRDGTGGTSRGARRGRVRPRARPPAHSRDGLSEARSRGAPPTTEARPCQTATWARPPSDRPLPCHDVAR